MSLMLFLHFFCGSALRAQPLLAGGDVCSPAPLLIILSRKGHDAKAADTSSRLLCSTALLAHRLSLAVLARPAP